MQNTTQKNTGFNLIELMVVLVIIAILITIAYPSYQHYMQRTRRQHAKVLLTKAASRLATYHSVHGSYYGVSFHQLGIKSNTPYYQFHLAKLNKQTFLLQAIPKGAQKKDSCGTLGIIESGKRIAAKHHC